MKNFDNENVKTKTESVLFNKEKRGSNCQKTGDIAKDCELKNSS